jgi:UDP-2,3-diacylglucosamine hydrolase
MRIVFFSDAHLDKKDDGRRDLLLRFIINVCQDADMLVIVGDLFEFYHGYDGYIYPWYKEVIESLKSIASKSKPVYFIEGNHEFKMGGFFEKYTGIRCVDDLTIDIDSKKILIAHGYQIRKNYLVKFLKTPFIYGIMDMFGPALTWKIAAVSGTFLSRKTKPFIANVMDIFREFARGKLDDGYDAVILAHSHIPDKMEYDSGNTTKHYLNTGDIIKSSTYVEYNTETGFEIKKYSYTTPLTKA